MLAAPRALEAGGESPHSRATGLSYRASSPPLTKAHYGNRTPAL